MRISAQTILAVFVLLVLTNLLKTTAYAQTTITPTPLVATTAQSSNTNSFELNTDPNVPRNQDSYTQVVLINVLSAAMCQLAGIDMTNPQQSCLGIDPSTGKIGMTPQNSQTIGGALGLMSGAIASLYIPAVSSSQYFNYLAGNFGITKPALAANAGGTACPVTFGYGFCGLAPIFYLWSGSRDFAYALLIILFIAIGIGVMVRFRVDPRTVMTLQNQIPRVIIAILLITFSYAIAGVMADLMWTTTYAGINFITNTTNITIDLCPAKPQLLNQVVDQRLLDEPLSFTNTVFRGNCNGGIDSGILGLSSSVSSAFGNLVTQVLSDLLGIGGACNNIFCPIVNFVANPILWVTEQIIKLIIIVALLIALFRLWFELIKAYVTFLIFVIMGPVWIVFGLIPGRPLGFEKWLRIIFANLAAFPLVACLLVFARVIVDSGAQAAVLGAATSAAGIHSSVLAAATTNAGGVGTPINSQTTFVPPLVGNPNISTFTAFIGFGAIMIAPTVPSLIKDRMKATGQGKYGATVAAGIGFAAGATTSPGRKTWEALNRKNSMTGQAEGSIAVIRQRMWLNTPLGKMGRRRRQISDQMWHNGKDYKSAREIVKDSEKK